MENQTLVAEHLLRAFAHSYSIWHRSSPVSFHLKKEEGTLPFGQSKEYLIECLMTLKQERYQDLNDIDECEKALEGEGTISKTIVLHFIGDILNSYLCFERYYSEEVEGDTLDFRDITDVEELKKYLTKAKTYIQVQLDILDMIGNLLE